MDLEERFSEEEIRSAVARIGREISADYRGDHPILVGILKGAFVFLADLCREITIPFEVDFVRARSYGTGMESSGTVAITTDPESNVAGRHVVVVEDIADTGLTLAAVVERIRAAGAASVRSCALLVREGHEATDYMGMWVAPGFVLGYGIDLAEGYRGLRDIRAIPGGGPADGRRVLTEEPSAPEQPPSQRDTVRVMREREAL